MSQTISEFLTNPQTGSFDVEGSFDSGVWYDWFCADKSLVNRGKSLATKFKAIANSAKFNNEDCYIFFKNNCPMSGPLYDSFTICDIHSGDVLYWVTPKSGHTGLAEVYGRDGSGQFGAVIKGTWKDVKSFFLK
jgi:hypothetical protein